jgi:hypothetical protein
MELILEHKFYLSTVFTTNLCPTSVAKLLTACPQCYLGVLPGRCVRRREYRNEYYA